MGLFSADSLVDLLILSSHDLFNKLLSVCVWKWGLCWMEEMLFFFILLGWGKKSILTMLFVSDLFARLSCHYYLLISLHILPLKILFVFFCFLIFWFLIFLRVSNKHSIIIINV